ncbi:MAG: uracil-DNA glycosylase family protein [Gemmatimonadota bacterium]
MPATLVSAARRLCRQVRSLSFGPPVAYVYNPLAYAWPLHEQYLKTWGRGTRRAVFLGMNPGPWGMAQTGVPFGEVAAVRDWLRLDAAVGRPEPEHPKRPVQGLACPRSEVSGARLWGLFAARFGTPEAFFPDHFVANYCPLVFLEASGRNRTPDKLAPSEREALLGPCDDHLRTLCAVLRPRWLIGVGRFAADRARAALEGTGVEVVQILHPSPASPLANRGWADVVTRQLQGLGIW